MKINRSYAPGIFYFTISILLFAYVAYRACTLSFTHDESLSYMILHGADNLTKTANNHFLNTNMMRMTSYLFGDSEFSLRLPNVLLFIIYLLGCYRILKQSENLWLFVSGTILLLLNPFVIDYFSLARGYGLSLGFLVAGLYYFLRERTNNYSFHSIIRDFTISVTFATMALFANFSTINYFIAVLLIFAIQYIRIAMNGSGFSVKQHFIFTAGIVLSFIPLIIAVKRLLWLSGSQQLYFGSESFGFTISSIIMSSMFYNEYQLLIGIIKYAVIIIFSSGIMFIILNKLFYGPFMKITALISAIICGLFIEHYLFGVKYPVERAAIYLIPLSGIFMYYFASNIINFIDQKKQTLFSLLLCLTISIPLCYNFISNLNLKYTYTWRYDAHTKDIIRIINESTGQVKGKKNKYKISNNWLMEPALNYYILSRKLNIEPATRDQVNPDADFIYEFTVDHHQAGYKELSAFPDIGTCLYQRIKN